MTGEQLAGWLRYLAEQVEGIDRVDGKPYRKGPIQVQVATPSGLRTYKQRHGSLDPPSVSDPSHDVIRDTIRDAFETHGETILGRIRDAVETAFEARGALTFSQRSKELEVVAVPIRSSHARATEQPTTATTTPSGTQVRRSERTKGQPPLPRKELMPIPLQAHEWEPMPDHREYASELGLTDPQFDQLLIELRDKHGLRPHTRDWWDDRCSRFIEARSKGGVRKAPIDQDAERRVPSAQERLALLRAEQGR